MTEIISGSAEEPDEIKKIRRVDFLNNAEAPAPGGIKIVLLRNPKDKDNRRLEGEAYGTLDEGAAEETEETAREFFDKMFAGMSPEERDKTKIMVFASSARLKEPNRDPSPHKRAVDGANSAIRGILESMETNGVPKERLTNMEREGDPRPYEMAGLRDLIMIEESPKFVEFLLNRAREKTKDEPGKFWLEFWASYENDTYRDERMTMGAEGPEDISRRMEFWLSLIIRSMRAELEERPDERLVLWVVSHYDSISPFLKGHVTGIGQDEWLPIEYGAGVIIKVDGEGNASCDIQDQHFEFKLGAESKPPVSEVVPQ